MLTPFLSPAVISSNTEHILQRFLHWRRLPSQDLAQRQVDLRAFSTLQCRVCRRPLLEVLRGSRWDAPCGKRRHVFVLGDSPQADRPSQESGHRWDELVECFCTCPGECDEFVLPAALLHEDERVQSGIRDSNSLRAPYEVTHRSHDPRRPFA